jgi:hypothetical protein
MRRLTTRKLAIALGLLFFVGIGVFGLALSFIGGASVHADSFCRAQAQDGYLGRQIPPQTALERASDVTDYAAVVYLTSGGTYLSQDLGRPASGESTPYLCPYVLRTGETLHLERHQLTVSGDTVVIDGTRVIRQAETWEDKTTWAEEGEPWIIRDARINLSNRGAVQGFSTSGGDVRRFDSPVLFLTGTEYTSTSYHPLLTAGLLGIMLGALTLAAGSLIALGGLVVRRRLIACV